MGRGREMRFSLFAVMGTVVILPLGVGLVVAVDELAFLAVWVDLRFERVLWDIVAETRETGIGGSAVVWQRLVLIELAFSGWLVLGTLGLTLGMIRSRRVRAVFWFVPISIFMAPLVDDLLGVGASFWSLNSPKRDVGACGALFVAGCWFAGYLFRGRKLSQTRGLPPWVNVVCLAFAGGVTLLLSTYGWTLLHDPEYIGGPVIVSGATVLFVLVLPSVPVLIVAWDIFSFFRYGSRTRRELQTDSRVP